MTKNNKIYKEKNLLIELATRMDTEEKKPNGKRRYCEEKDADPIKEVLTITMHREAKFQECGCGYKIKNKHICESDITTKTKLIFIECDKAYEICCNWVEAERNLKRYNKQGYVDRDGYTYCEECENHSAPG